MFLPSLLLKVSSEYTFCGYSSSSSFSRRTFSLRNDFVNCLAHYICSLNTIRMKRMAFPWIFLHPINTLNQAFHVSFPYPNPCSPCWFGYFLHEVRICPFLSGPRNNLIIADIFAFFSWICTFYHIILYLCQKDGKLPFFSRF